jgi:hypothetical protein
VGEAKRSEISLKIEISPPSLSASAHDSCLSG